MIIESNQYPDTSAPNNETPNQYNKQIVAIENYIQRLEKRVEIISEQVTIYEEFFSHFDADETPDKMKKIKNIADDLTEAFKLLEGFRPRNRSSIQSAKSLVESSRDFLLGMTQGVTIDLQIKKATRDKYDKKLKELKEQRAKLGKELRGSIQIKEALEHGDDPAEVLTDNSPQYIKSLFN